MRIKTSRVVGVILLGLLVAMFLRIQVNSTLSDFIAFAVMLVGVWVLSAREKERQRRGAQARDEARAGGTASRPIERP